MSSLLLQLRAGQRIAIFGEDGHAEMIAFDTGWDRAGEPVVIDHAMIRNRYGDESIYDDVSAHFRGDPVDAVPANTYGCAGDGMTPALLERSAPLSPHLVS